MEILRLEPNGNIIWNSPKGKIVITDQKMLWIALYDFLSKLNIDLDLSKVDKNLWEEYKKLTQNSIFRKEIGYCKDCKFSKKTKYNNVFLECECNKFTLGPDFGCIHWEEKASN